MYCIYNHKTNEPFNDCLIKPTPEASLVLRCHSSQRDKQVESWKTQDAA